MENIATPEKQPATSQPQQFSPTPTQPSPNITIPVPPQQPQSTQPTSTSPVPSFSTFFPNFDNNQPTSTQTTSLQHPTTTQTVNLQQSSPYVRIIPDDTPSPIQTQAPNATSIQQATRPVISQQSQPMPNLYRSTIYDQGNNSGDFMVVDYAPSLTYEQPQVVLGRPFLYTTNAQIDCRSGMVTMSYKNRKLYFNVFLKTISYDPVNDACHTVATNEHDSSVTKDRLEASGYRVKKSSVRRPFGGGKPPDGGSGWGNETVVNPNQSETVTLPKRWMDMYGETCEGKRAAEPP
ncbi:uncharacterized protein LOC110913655 [Helianthus annuus]|uniref:uncharacterized protein LOC110913655 n=1 Tax=Helianthus annuus TaxID=4232 RepID=UPI000B9033B6|nr:uncharacterized protein LOC110913655 [Helianthus annuus]